MTEHNYYKEFRCEKCKKLLFRGLLVDSDVEVKCKRCSTVNEFHGEPASKYHCPVADTCPHNPK